MKTKLFSLLLTVALLVGIVCGVPVTVSAQETNGIYTYDRAVCKLDPDVVKKWNRIMKDAVKK